jgi:hypothetical protein
MKIMGDEKGPVTYNVGEGQQKETAVLSFENPLSGSNSCRVTIEPSTSYVQNCHTGSGHNAQFEYTLHGSTYNK